MSVALAVQKAIYERLNAALAGVAPVYDDMPGDAAYPFVDMAMQMMAPRDTLAQIGFSHSMFLSVFSAYRGKLEVETILGKIRDAMHGASFGLDDGRLVRSSVIEAQAFPDADGVTFQGAATIRLFTD